MAQRWGLSLSLASRRSASLGDLHNADDVPDTRTNGALQCSNSGRPARHNSGEAPMKRSKSVNTLQEESEDGLSDDSPQPKPTSPASYALLLVAKPAHAGSNGNSSTALSSLSDSACSGGPVQVPEVNGQHAGLYGVIHADWAENCDSGCASPSHCQHTSPSEANQSPPPQTSVAASGVASPAGGYTTGVYSSTDDNVQGRLPSIRIHTNHHRGDVRNAPGSGDAHAPRDLFSLNQPATGSRPTDQGPSTSADTSRASYRRAASSYAALEHCPVAGDNSSDSDTEEATRRITAAYRSMQHPRHGALGGLIGVDSAPSTPTGGGWSGSRSHPTNAKVDDAAAGHGAQAPARKRGSYHLTNTQAAVELFLRLNHARQTLDFVKRQTTEFAALNKAELSIWEALHLLDELREYESVLMSNGDDQQAADMTLLEHAFQAGELCRLHYPDKDWLHLLGLIHGLGKLLAHRRLGSQPQWAICGETFPVGCRFSPAICGAQYFTANPDRRRRLYNTPLGIYSQGCGLQNVFMSWGGPEYLHLVLELNKAELPPEAMFVVRNHKFCSLTKADSCYLALCSEDDKRLLPLLRHFQDLCAWRITELPDGFGLQGEAREAYYTGLIHKYIGLGKLHW